MSNTENKSQHPDTKDLVKAISRNMGLTDGGRRTFRALAILLTLSLAHEQIDGINPADLKNVSNDVLALIEFYDECVYYHENTTEEEGGQQ